MSILGLMSDRAQNLMRDLGLLVLRLTSGLFMAYGHGYGKMMAFNERSASFPDPLGLGSPTSMVLAIFGELVCAVLLALGLFTRAAAVPAAITMLVAAFVVHADDPFKKKELALMYLSAYSVLLLTGPGRFSLDAHLMPRILRKKEPAS